MGRPAMWLTLPHRWSSWEQGGHPLTNPPNFMTFASRPHARSFGLLWGWIRCSRMTPVPTLPRGQEPNSGTQGTASSSQQMPGLEPARAGHTRPAGRANAACYDPNRLTAEREISSSRRPCDTNEEVFADEIRQMLMNGSVTSSSLARLWFGPIRMTTSLSSEPTSCSTVM